MHDAEHLHKFEIASSNIQRSPLGQNILVASIPVSEDTSSRRLPSVVCLGLELSEFFLGTWSYFFKLWLSSFSVTETWYHVSKLVCCKMYLCWISSGSAVLELFVIKQLKSVIKLFYIGMNMVRSFIAPAMIRQSWKNDKFKHEK